MNGFGGFGYDSFSGNSTNVATNTNSTNSGGNKEIKKDIKKILGTLGEENTSGWSMKACIISWNGGVDKLDIRQWNSDMTRCSKGISLTSAETEQLYLILNSLYGRR